MSSFSVGGQSGYRSDGQFYIEDGTDSQAAVSRQQYDTARQFIIYTRLNAASLTLAATHVYLSVKYTITGTVALTLPAIRSGGVGGGKIYYIKDTGNNAAVNNITITPNGTETIDGAASYVINTNRASIILVSNDIDGIWEIN